MNGLTCDITFMLRYPYLFNVIMIVFIPCMTLLTLKLYAALEAIISKEVRG